MGKEFLGKGWKFPVNVDFPADCVSQVNADQTGAPAMSIAMSQHEQDIAEAIRIILGTSKGERVMHPDFGCGIHDLIFSVINSATAGRIKESVREALILWEPRIELKDVTVTTGEPNEKGIASEERILISIDYLVKATNSRFNLVYPFYLKE